MKVWPQASFALLAVATLACQSAARPQTAEGFWTGAIEVPDRQLQVAILVEKQDEAWKAMFYAPAQGIHAAEMENVVLDGRSVTFRIPRSAGDPTFHGQLSEDGGTISGDFTQSDQTMTFRLTRSEIPEGFEKDPYAEFREPGAPGEGLEGRWRAVLITGPNKMRLVMTVREAASGDLEGSIDSIDQESAELAVPLITRTDDEVWFQMLDIGAEFKGTIRPDGSEIIGVWVQTGREFPISFRRMDG